MKNIEILLTTVCEINYNDNCGNCPLRINGRCKALTKDNTYNMELEKVAKDFIKDKSVFIYQSKNNIDSYYVTNGRINKKGNYLLARLGLKNEYNILVDELELINGYNEIKII
ncbi:TPA: hypothetical protein N2D10_003285 [Clostridium botulinum]|nr:hypothetical protein [Clostridium botulinum]